MGRVDIRAETISCVPQRDRHAGAEIIPSQAEKIAPVRGRVRTFRRESATRFSRYLIQQVLTTPGAIFVPWKVVMQDEVFS